jgi:hypothetical protein
MLNGIQGYYMVVIAPGFFVQRFTLDPLPPGTNVYANVSLSDINTLFYRNDPDPKFAATAFVDSWTVYEPDGTQSAPQQGPLRANFNQNAIWVENCATITFALIGWRAEATAQINILTL